MKDAWNIQKDKVKVEKNQNSCKVPIENIINSIYTKETNNISFPLKKGINSAINLHSIPKSSDNIVSQRMMFKKPSNSSINDEPLSQIKIPDSKSIIKPRILKSTTPYKSEKKEIMKKVSEKEMNFEDINNFKVIYKYEEKKESEKVSKLPTINKTINPTPSFNNTFNPFNQTIRSKINNLDSKELTFSDNKMFLNSNTQNFVKNPSAENFQRSNQISDSKKVRTIKDLFKNHNEMPKINQKVTTLDPIIIQKRNSEEETSHLVENSNLQKNKFPKDVFFRNIQKKFII